MDETPNLFSVMPKQGPQQRCARVRIDRAKAEAILMKEGARVAGHIYERWSKPIETLSNMADEGSRTHIAFLGTAILAKCVAPDVDVFAVKADAGDGAYSARGLCHGVLVPNAPELDINLGVTGREPLNNQPYFRISRVDRSIRIRSTARPVLNQLCDILDELQKADDEEARQALRAFIEVRRRFGRRYTPTVSTAVPLAFETLLNGIKELVEDASEGGRRAQAVVAAVMDIFAGEDRVDSRRVNDPSRSVPGDVNVRRVSGHGWERVYEVRDKAVSREDLYLFATKCVENDVDEAIVVAVADTEPPTKLAEAQAWSAQRGVALSLFSSWEQLLAQALHWAPTSSLGAAQQLPALIEKRLIQSEVTPAALELWRAFIAEHASASSGASNETQD